jgi:hypothetical protein
MTNSQSTRLMEVFELIETAEPMMTGILFK